MNCVVGSKVAILFLARGFLCVACVLAAVSVTALGLLWPLPLGLSQGS